MAKIFSFTDMLPSTATIRRNTPTTTNKGGGITDVWSNIYTSKACSVQHRTGGKIAKFGKDVIEYTNAIYFNEDLPLVRNGDSVLVGSICYKIVDFGLQGDGGADGTDLVFAIYAIRTTA